MGSRQVRDEDLRASDLVLLLLAASGRGDSAQDRLNGITRLEKLLFLAEQETELSKEAYDRFEFKAYDYGPYSKGVYEAVDLLEEAGLLNEERAYAGQPLDEMEEWTAVVEQREGVERRFTLTDRGKAIAAFLGQKHPDVASALAQVKAKYGAMPLRSLIRYVYSTYPPFAAASKIRDKIG
jgi:hypothetical protein